MKEHLFPTCHKYWLNMCQNFNVLKLQSVRTALSYNVSLSMDEIIDAESSCTYYEAKVALELLIVTLSWHPDWL